MYPIYRPTLPSVAPPKAPTTSSLYCKYHPRQPQSPYIYSFQLSDPFTLSHQQPTQKAHTIPSLCTPASSKQNRNKSLNAYQPTQSSAAVPPTLLRIYLTTSPIIKTLPYFSYQEQGFPTAPLTRSNHSS
jgi:hypothetical protein